MNEEKTLMICNAIIEVAKSGANALPGGLGSPNPPRVDLKALAQDLCEAFAVFYLKAVMKIRTFIGSALIWAGFYLLSYRRLAIPGKLLSGLIVQPELPSTLSTLPVFLTPPYRGSVFLEPLSHYFCKTQLAHQLEQDRDEIQWRRWESTPEEIEAILRAAQDRYSEVLK